mgnify:CR=1 FL=1
MRRSGLIATLILALALPGIGLLPAGSVGLEAAAAGRVVVTQVAVKVISGRVQIGIVASAPVEYRTMTLGDPDRLVVDIPGAVNGVAGSVLPVHQGPVAQIRVGQFQDIPPVVRVVVDLVRAAKFDVTMSSPTVVAIGFAMAAPATSRPGGAPGQSSTGAQRVTASTGGSIPGVPAQPAGAGVSGVDLPVSAGPGIVVVRQPGAVPGGVIKLNLDLRDAQLADVLDALARLCGQNLVTDSSVTGKVTIHLVGVTCAEALGFLLEANGLGYRRVGETLIVQPASKLAPPPPGPVVRVYHLQFLQPPLTTAEGLVGGGSGTSTLPGAAGPVKKDVGVLVALFAPTGATVGYDDRTNALIVSGTPAQQEAVAGLLTQLDVPIGQVTVQALVVDITSSSLKNLGVEWSIMNGIQFQEIPLLTPGPLAPTGLPPGLLGVQAITRDLLFAKLRLLVQQSNAKVLSDPRMTTFDGQEALIFAGDQIPIVNTTTAGNPPVTTQTVTFQPIGVTLKIIPKVNADRTISVQIHPLVTNATSFTQATSGNPNGLPIIATREAVTSLRVGDGDSIILGGLMKFSDVQTLTKLPLLGDLPFIGSLFRFSNVTHSESEVVIIMTPRILALPPAHQ